MEDLIFELLEQLYNTKNGINKRRIDEIAIALCDEFDINPEFIEGGLCIKHIKEK